MCFERQVLKDRRSVALVWLVWGWVTGSGFISALRKGLASNIWPSGEGVIGRPCSRSHPKEIFIHATLCSGPEVWHHSWLVQWSQGWKYGAEPRGGTSVFPMEQQHEAEFALWCPSLLDKCPSLGSGWDKAPTLLKNGCFIWDNLEPLRHSQFCFLTYLRIFCTELPSPGFQLMPFSGALCWKWARAVNPCFTDHQCQTTAMEHKAKVKSLG